MQPPPKTEATSPLPAPTPPFSSLPFPSLPQYCCPGQVSLHPTSTAAWHLVGFRSSWMVWLGVPLFCFRSLMNILRHDWPLPWITLGIVCLLRCSCRSAWCRRPRPWTLRLLVVCLGLCGCCFLPGLEARRDPDGHFVGRGLVLAASLDPLIPSVPIVAASGVALACRL